MKKPSAKLTGEKSTRPGQKTFNGGRKGGLHARNKALRIDLRKKYAGK